MPIATLLSDPLQFASWLLAILVALTVHEFSHAATATLLGDDTAERAGRLSLNPLAHIDTLGLILLVLIGFGWGRPVPVNPHNLKYPRWGDTIVALAGPLANLLSIIIFTLAIRAMMAWSIGTPFIVTLFMFIIVINGGLMLFNLLPVPPLDGSSIWLNLLPNRFWRLRALIQTRGPIILLALIIIDRLFNGIVFGSLFSLMFRLLQALTGLS